MCEVHWCVVTSREIPDAPRHAPLMSSRTPRASSAITPYWNHWLTNYCWLHL